MKKLKIRLTFTEGILGTATADPEIYSRFIGSKSPDAATLPEEVAALGEDAIIERGTTVFPKDEDGTPFLWDYQVKGFFKDACGMLARLSGKDPATGKKFSRAARNAAAEEIAKLVQIETPANPTLKVSDIATIAKLADEANPDILVSVDNTFNTPYNVRPLDLGADIVIESLTKYINGHGDALGGSIATTKARTDQIRFTAQVNFGGIISPFNAWLINRGSVTLPLRIRQHNALALAIAKHLESLDVVRFVAYPGLESHLHHEVAASQLARPDSGFGGVLSFGLDTNHDGHNRFVSKLNVITSAVSLGHDESLIVFLGEDDERQYLYPPEFHRGFFRLAVGLEDTDDLIRDIDHALAEAGFEV